MHLPNEVQCSPLFQLEALLGITRKECLKKFPEYQTLRVIAAINPHTPSHERHFRIGIAAKRAANVCPVLPCLLLARSQRRAPAQPTTPSTTFPPASLVGYLGSATSSPQQPPFVPAKVLVSRTEEHDLPSLERHPFPGLTRICRRSPGMRTATPQFLKPSATDIPIQKGDLTEYLRLFSDCGPHVTYDRKKKTHSK